MNYGSLRAPQAVYAGLSNKIVSFCMDERAGEVNLDSEYHPKVITDRTGDVRAHKPSNGSIAAITAGIGEIITGVLTSSLKNVFETTLDSRLNEGLRNLIKDEVIQITFRLSKFLGRKILNPNKSCVKTVRRSS